MRLPQGKALVITGKQGSGKTSLAYRIGGPKARIITHADIKRKFNSFLCNARTFIVDEVPIAKIQELKSFVANDDLEICTKGQDPVMIPMPQFIFVCTGDLNALKSLSTDRRFMVIDLENGKL